MTQASGLDLHDLDNRYHRDLLEAYLRGVLGEGFDAASLEACVREGERRELRLHRFKRTRLPRVQRALGALRGLGPESLLDVGSGRGAFLWPLLEAFPTLPVTTVDVLAHRVEMLQAVSAGGLERLSAYEMDATELDFDDDLFDVVTVLEVLEHLETPLAAVREVVRVAQRFVVASVPSTPDDNLEHIQLFTPDTLTEVFLDAGATKVRIDHVLNHMVAVVTVTESA